MILPDAMLGMLGGGQLGRMFTLAAHTMGYRVTVVDPDPFSPAGSIADVHLETMYQDREALEQLSDTCLAVTTEFENVPAESLRWLAAHCAVRPPADSLAIAQDRVLEKQFLVEQGFSVAPFAVIGSQQDCDNASAALYPGVLKRARFGYDGRGQARVATSAEARSAFIDMGSELCVLEKIVALDCEISVVVARGADGAVRSFPVAENLHVNGILDVTIVPARVRREFAERAAVSAQAIGDGLAYCGVFAVEFFVTIDGELLVNEIAPRPHNSGHYTIDACVTSQFEQQVRTLCGLPLGESRLLSPVVMVNLMGDLWRRGNPPWQLLFDCPDAKLHLYGKREPRPGRKMGHYTVLGTSTEAALQKALTIRAQLSSNLV